MLGYPVSDLIGLIVLIDIDLMFRTGGMRVLLQTLVDGPAELGPAIAQAFLVIVDSPRTRAYMRPKIDLEVLFPILSIPSSPPSHSDLIAFDLDGIIRHHRRVWERERRRPSGTYEDMRDYRIGDAQVVEWIDVSLYG